MSEDCKLRVKLDFDADDLAKALVLSLTAKQLAEMLLRHHPVMASLVAAEITNKMMEG